MDGDSNYISLQEATKFCDYTQEYLSLRARQGKLKSVKFGRNWVTKEDWLREYLGEIAVQKNSSPTFILKPIFSLGMVFILFAANIALGKEGLSQAFETVDPYVVKIGESSKTIIAFGKEGAEIIFSDINFGLASAAEIVGTNLRDYFSWLESGYISANNFVEEKIADFRNED